MGCNDLMAYQYSGLSDLTGTQPSCCHLLPHAHQLNASTDRSGQPAPAPASSRSAATRHSDADELGFLLLIKKEEGKKNVLFSQF